MRLVETFKSPVCTASVFTFNGKLILKCEAGPMEQVFKFPEEEFGMEKPLKSVLSDEFWQSVAKRFDEMFADMQKVLKTSV